MPSLPRVTVVTPSFQQARYLDATLRSILDQGYPDLETIVMDGGSDDGSVAIIERHAPRLAHWQSAPDDGQAAALRAGFERATGEVLLWVNSDDLLLPGSLEAVGRFFAAHPRESFVVAHALQVDARGHPERRSYATPPTFESLVWGGENPGFAQPSAAWRREAYRSAGGLDPSYRFAMDVDLWVRLARVRPARLLDRFTSAFRMHPEAKTSTLDDVRRAEVERVAVAYGRDGVPAWRRAWRRKRARQRRRFYRWRGARHWRDEDPEREALRYALREETAAGDGT